MGTLYPTDLPSSSSKVSGDSLLSLAACPFLVSLSSLLPPTPSTHTHTEVWLRERLEFNLTLQWPGRRVLPLLPPHPPRFSTLPAVRPGPAPDSQWGRQGQLGRLPGGQVGGQGHQGGRICAHAQPDGEDPQQEGAAGGSPCPLDVPLGPSLVGLWRRWAAVTQASPLPTLLPAAPDPCPGPAPTGTPRGSFRDSKNREQPLWATHRGAQVANKNRPLTRCYRSNSLILTMTQR